MSEWETVAPRAGQRAKAGGVTVGWRKVSSARFCAVLTLSRDVLTMLNLTEPAKDEPRRRILVQRSRAANALRLIVSDAPDAWALHWKQGCGTVALPLDGVSLDKRQPAQRAPHTLDGAGLVVTLPDWARQQPPTPLASTHRTSAAAMHTPKPSDADPNCPLAKLPADDLAEARQMMRTGRIGGKGLSEYFGWELDRAVKIAAAIRDEQALAKRTGHAA